MPTQDTVEDPIASGDLSDETAPTLPPTSTPEGLQGDGLTIREAAISSGMTEKMIRVRIRNGTIESWKVQGKFGTEWRVRLPGSGEVIANDGTTGANGELELASVSSSRVDDPSLSQNPPENVVPVEVFSELMLRHEELAIRLGRAEAQLEARSEGEAEKSESPAPVVEDIQLSEPTSPSQSVERLQRIARGEAEARYKAEAEVEQLKKQLKSVETINNEMKRLLTTLGMTGR